jgi:hypothetical protein
MDSFRAWIYLRAASLKTIQIIEPQADLGYSLIEYVEQLGIFFKACFMRFTMIKIGSVAPVPFRVWSLDGSELFLYNPA